MAGSTGAQDFAHHSTRHAGVVMFGLVDRHVLLDQIAFREALFLLALQTLGQTTWFVKTTE